MVECEYNAKQSLQRKALFLFLEKYKDGYSVTVTILGRLTQRLSAFLYILMFMFKFFG